MVKSKTQYQCTACGGTAPKWQGRCPHCGEWNTLEETVVLPVATSGRFQSWAAEAGQVQNLAHVTAVEVPRTPTGMGELDRVLGGGVVDGAVILLGGDPGIGKSTLLLQTVALMAQHEPILYVSGEESASKWLCVLNAWMWLLRVLIYWPKFAWKPSVLRCCSTNRKWW